MIHLTIIVPAYNEDKIIRKSIERTIKFLNSKKYSWKIIVVDDGSTDLTSAIVGKIKNDRVELVVHDMNMGKGAALRSGVEKVRSKYIIFMDADLSVPLKFVDDMLERLGEGNPVVVGSRRMAKSVIAKHQPFLREKMGVVFTQLTKLITGVRLNDFTCGFKGFESNAARIIFSKSVVDRWAYDAEIMFIANKCGFDIVQIPVRWANREESKVRLGNAITTSIVDLINIRINNFRGIYE